MPRRVSLPAADELFRTTGGSAVQPSAPTGQNHTNGEEPQGKSAPSTRRVPAPAGGQDAAAASAGDGESPANEDAADGEHSAAVEGDEPAADGGSGHASNAGGGEHTGREGVSGEQRAAQHRTVPGQGAPKSPGADGGRGSPGADVPSRPAEGGASGRAEQAAGRVSKPAQRTKSSRTAEPRTRQPAGSPGRRGARGANRRPSGRERHDEKITVYVSAEELMDLEHARLVLRGEHGLAVDRGRIVREAVAVVLADLESRGDASILVRRLRGS